MAEITTTQAFSDGDTVTATKLNNITANAALQTEAITNRSAETTVDQANDLLLMYDASATALKKITLSNAIKAGTASNFPVTGNATIGGTLGVTGAITASSTVNGTTIPTSKTLVTTDDTQTLTNKTLTSPAISGGTINNASVGATTPSTGAFTTLSASSTITSAAGTAAAPAIVPTGDTNTGIFFPAADTIAFSEGGTEAMRIDSSGNLILTSNKSLINYGAGGITTNSAIGSGALQANTTGNYNTANGVNALYSNTTGSQNTANGYAALYSNTTGNYNTANGVAALFSNTTGDNNTACGDHAGYGTGSNANTTGSNNVFLGNEAVGTSSTASNVITLGNSAIATLRCQQTSISSLSDRRDKKDIVSLTSGLSLIQELRPVSFVWDMRSKAKVGQPEIGFIAQELQEAQAKSGLSVPHLVNDDNPEKLEAAPATLIPILVRAVQELSNKVSELEAKLQGA